jgi:undecaprenyl-diphosphatase
MLSYIQAIILGALQGITELFPISSLGHSVIFPRLFGWHINQRDDFFLVFLVLTHFATALVLLGFFWRDWLRVVKGIGRSFRVRGIKVNDTDAKLAWLLIVATVPPGILGLLFEEKIKTLLASPSLVALFLILNGILLYIGEVLRRSSSRLEGESADSDTRIARLSWAQTVQVGFMECLALIPGFSRTGSTIAGGLFVGLTHEDAARFSFLLATPIIFAASLLKLPELALGKTEFVIPALVGALSAAVAAYFSVRFLTKYFKTNTLTPFAIYCVAFGIAVSLIFLVQ